MAPASWHNKISQTHSNTYTQTHTHLSVHPKGIHQNCIRCNTQRYAYSKQTVCDILKCLVVIIDNPQCVLLSNRNTHYLNKAYAVWRRMPPMNVRRIEPTTRSIVHCSLVFEWEGITIDWHCLLITHKSSPSKLYMHSMTQRLMRASNVMLYINHANLTNFDQHIFMCGCLHIVGWFIVFLCEVVL